MKIAIVLSNEFYISKVNELICFLKDRISYSFETYILIRGKENKSDELKKGADFIFFCDGNIYEFNEECIKWIYKHSINTIIMMDDYNGKLKASYTATKIGGA